MQHFSPVIHYHFPKGTAIDRLQVLIKARDELQAFVNGVSFPKLPKHFRHVYAGRLRDLIEDCKFLKHLINT